MNNKKCALSGCIRKSAPPYFHMSCSYSVYIKPPMFVIQCWLTFNLGEKALDCNAQRIRTYQTLLAHKNKLLSVELWWQFLMLSRRVPLVCHSNIQTWPLDPPRGILRLIEFYQSLGEKAWLENVISAWTLHGGRSKNEIVVNKMFQIGVKWWKVVSTLVGGKKSGFNFG